MKTFKDHPEFKPDYSPKEMIKAGIFGGIYFNPEGGRRGLFSKRVDIDHTEFPKSWFKGVPESYYLSKKYDPNINKYGVSCGTNQEFWERAGWITRNSIDPRGWVEWYCKFYQGRRTDDDERQIKRWLGVCGPNGRFRRYLENLVAQGKDSPKIRQTLLHWGCKS